MDNICHTLAGAVLADAGLKRRTALGYSTLLIASNLPDVDVAVFATDTLPMAFRRGWTHGVPAMAVLPLALAAVMSVAARARGVSATKGAKGPLSFRWLFVLSCIGAWLHVFMDFLNTYGVRLLMPFSNRWFYGDALYIVDPILYVLFIAAIVLFRRDAAFDSRRSLRPNGRRRAGFMAAALAGGYMLLMLASNTWARAEVRDGLVRAGRSADTRFMVTPVIYNPLRREVVIDMGDRYEKGFLWFDPLPHFRPAGYGVNTRATEPFAQRAARTRRGREYLSWSRFPFFVPQPGSDPPRVQLNDYRYAGPEGRNTWLSTMVELPPEPPRAPVQ